MNVSQLLSVSYCLSVSQSISQSVSDSWCFVFLSSINTALKENVGNTVIKEDDDPETSVPMLYDYNRWNCLVLVN